MSTKSRVVVGEDSAGKESPAVFFRLVPRLAYLGGTVEPIELLSRAAQPTGSRGQQVQLDASYLLATSGCSQSPVCSSNTIYFHVTTKMA